MHPSLREYPSGWAHRPPQGRLYLGEVDIDSNGLQEKIQTKILKLGFRQICHSIFLQFCPGYSDQPHAALNHICQSSTGPNCQLVMLTVIKFYQRLMNSAIIPSAFAISSFRSLIVASFHCSANITQGMPIAIASMNVPTKAIIYYPHGCSSH